MPPKVPARGMEIKSVYISFVISIAVCSIDIYYMGKGYCVDIHCKSTSTNPPGHIMLTL